MRPHISYDNVKGKKNVKHSAIPAVEVEHAGCSFNPEPESHRDVLARAVADEMRKIYKNKLGPKPIPLVAPEENINEENRYFLEADSGSEDNVDNETPIGDVDDTTTEKRSKTKRVTRVKSNRRPDAKCCRRQNLNQRRKCNSLKRLTGCQQMVCTPSNVRHSCELENVKKLIRLMDGVDTYCIFATINIYIIYIEGLTYIVFSLYSFLIHFGLTNLLHNFFIFINCLLFRKIFYYYLEIQF